MYYITRVTVNGERLLFKIEFFKLIINKSLDEHLF